VFLFIILLLCHVGARGSVAVEPGELSRPHGGDYYYYYYYYTTRAYESRGIAVGIATGYRLNDLGGHSSSLGRAKNFRFYI
jgi:hypothetical protein